MLKVIYNSLLLFYLYHIHHCKLTKNTFYVYTIANTKYRGESEFMSTPLQIRNIVANQNLCLHNFKYEILWRIRIYVYTIANTKYRGESEFMSTPLQIRNIVANQNLCLHHCKYEISWRIRITATMRNDWFNLYAVSLFMHQHLFDQIQAHMLSTCPHHHTINAL